MNSSVFMSQWGQKLGKKLMKPVQKFKPNDQHGNFKRWNIVKGDIIEVIQGPQVGKRGKIMAVLREKNRVIVEGVNMRRRIVKPKMDGTPGRIITAPCSIHYSNVMLVDPSIDKPTKVSRGYLEDGTKVRVSKKSGNIIPKPEFVRDIPRTMVMGPKDTKPEDVFEVTFADYEKYLPYMYGDHGKYEKNKQNSNGDNDDEFDKEKESSAEKMQSNE